MIVAIVDEDDARILEHLHEGVGGSRQPGRQAGPSHDGWMVAMGQPDCLIGYQEIALCLRQDTAPQPREELGTEGGCMPKLRHGHAPGHVQDTFLAAVEAFYRWRRGQPEPTVEYEINYVPHEIPISRACGLVWNCSDILPGTSSILSPT
jgi:hypothetical protein